MARTAKLLAILFPFLVFQVDCQTPVIGGSCKLGTADVQIGGKQTQFFLKCEATSDSGSGEGVWVVKSRMAVTQPSTSVAVPSENTQAQQHPKIIPKQNSPNICEQDVNAREADSCAVSATCLQASQDTPSSYLQCDQTYLRWIRKSCQEGFLFNFEQQTCIVPKRITDHVSRNRPSGLVCTFSSCSSSNPCSVGTCNNGYCCSSGGTSGGLVVPVPTNGCIGCGSAAHPKIITIPQNMCPGGGYGVGSCNSGYCSPGYSCIQNSCCPSFSPMRQIFTCPSGSPPVGACMSGSCATGYSCIQNSCCSSPTTQNPFVCPNGNQAAGGCVNGQCGTGYTCQNGLCCAGSSTSTVRCLDGSEAVGACIPSCQGNACGGMQISYYCGSGYTCTTGNICCPVNSCPNGGEPLGPTVNGLCPTGYTVQGSLCCSSLCPGGSAGSPAVNGLCPAGLTLTNGICCSSNFAVCESAEISIGPCINGGCTDLGYACDAEQMNCCPLVNYKDPANQVGPGLNGICPVGYAIVYIPGENLNEDGTNPGTCVSLQSIPGICSENAQSGPCANKNCPNGFTCFTAADVCCPTNAFRRLRPGQSFPASQRPPNYGRPLHSYMSPRIDATLCPNRAASAGPCMNDLCGIGLECQNGQCCQPEKAISNLKSMCPNGQTAVSGCFADGTCGTSFECVKSINLCCPPGGNHILPPTNRISPNPIGARCMQDMECVGYNDGLSLCHAGVCQCSPIAYSQGIACVQRKAFHLKMNDSPVETEKQEMKSN